MPDIRMFEGARGLPRVSATINEAAGTGTVVAAVAGRSIRVHSLALTSVGAMVFQFRDDTGGAQITEVMRGPLGTMIVLPFSEVGWFETTAGNLLSLVNSGASAVTGHMVYTLV